MPFNHLGGISVEPRLKCPSISDNSFKQTNTATSHPKTIHLASAHLVRWFLTNISHFYMCLPIIRTYERKQTLIGYEFIKKLNQEAWTKSRPLVWCCHTFMAEFGVQWKNPNLSQSQVKFGQNTVQASFHIRSKMIWKTQWRWILIRSTSISICEHNAFLSHVPDLVLRLLFPLVYVSYVSWDVHPEILASTSNWSFEEKTFVKQSLGTVLEILTKLLCFAHAWLCYALRGVKHSVLNMF